MIDSDLSQQIGLVHLRALHGQGKRAYVLDAHDCAFSFVGGNEGRFIRWNDVATLAVLPLYAGHDEERPVSPSPQPRKSRPRNTPDHADFTDNEFSARPKL